MTNGRSDTGSDTRAQELDRFPAWSTESQVFETGLCSVASKESSPCGLLVRKVTVVLGDDRLLVIFNGVSAPDSVRKATHAALSFGIFNSLSLCHLESGRRLPLSAVRIQHPSNKAAPPHPAEGSYWVLTAAPIAVDLVSQFFGTPKQEMLEMPAVATETSGMRIVWRELERLVSVNAQHRSGFRLGEVSTFKVLHQAAGELLELAATPSDPMELADLLSILFHYAIRKGWAMADLERLMLEKLKERFTQ